MTGLLAFSFRCCDSCVRLVKQLLKRHGSMDWWRIEALLIAHQSNHKKPHQPLMIYPLLRDVPATKDKELTGQVLLEIYGFSDALANGLNYELEQKKAISFKGLQNYVWKHSQCYWLDLQLMIDTNGIHFAHLTVSDMDISALSNL